MDSGLRTASRFAPRVKLSEALNEEEVDKVKELKFYAKRRSLMQKSKKADDVFNMHNRSLMHEHYSEQKNFFNSSLTQSVVSSSKMT